MKERADVLLFKNGDVDSREKAKRLIMSGEVFIGTQRVEKPGELVDVDAELYIKSKGLKYVSRGGFKLEGALASFPIVLKDAIAADVGSSTGGFTDCMLQNGAAKVYAIDVGTNQLDYKLRVDPRVVVMEQTNFRTFETASIEQVDFLATDVSFISLEHILPNAYKLLKNGAAMVALIKPQFEAGRDKVGKKGIVRDEKVHKDVVEKIVNFSSNLGFSIQGLTTSPITGTKGNREFLIYLEKSDKLSHYDDIDQIIKGV
ncbi:TlyA family RNA methyltransferase [Peptoniphilus equinus]|uniref:TlyA family RNA methyltransferase n=1 Tax=Peptoniphilus equinus TaxID=3016343 RepID=A0ABY7QW49_9FIRM|nr:TlyA family RNA methyltransferase [Peptoniphilus equinus]WBW50596.1 TlyA family RNA methyltransferase [Peptoniphilus equinus]